MTISLPQRHEHFEVVLRKDSALDMTDEELDQYQETYSPELLKFKEGEEPTTFVMRKVLPWEVQNSVDSASRKIIDGKPAFDFSSMNLAIKGALVDIRNLPGDLKFKKDGDGTAAKDLMEILAGAGIIDELFLARQRVMDKGGASLKKK